MIYRGGGMPSGAFSSKTPADRFVMDFTGIKSGYSVEMTVTKNPGEKHHVVIRKTMAYVPKVRKERKDKYRANINSLESFFN